MRFYKLTFYDDKDKELVKFQSGVPFPRHDNFTPLQLEFEKSTYEAGNGSQDIDVNFWINLHLQSISTFVDLQRFEKLKIKFDCGFDKESRLVKKLGYITPTTQTIYTGEVASITGNFTTKESFIHISGTNFQKNDEIIGVDTFVQIRQGELLFGSGEATYNSDDNVSYAQGIINCYERYYRNRKQKPIYIIHKDLANKRWERPLGYNLKLEGKLNDYEHSISKFENILKKDLKIEVNKPSENLVAFIPDPLTEVKKDKNYAKLTPAQLSGRINYMRNKLIMEANTSGDKRGSSASEKSFGVAKKISYAELLDYPTFKGFSQGIDVALALRPDMRLGGVVEMPEGAVISKIGASLREGFIASNDAGKLNITMKGKYKIIGVMHRGSFYGKSPTNWATYLNLLPDKLDEQYNKALKG